MRYVVHLTDFQTNCPECGEVIHKDIIAGTIKAVTEEELMLTLVLINPVYCNHCLYMIDVVNVKPSSYEVTEEYGGLFTKKEK